MPIFKDSAGKSKDAKVIYKIFSHACDRHVKIDITHGDNTVNGMLNALEKKRVVFFSKEVKKFDKKYQIFFYISGYLFDIKTEIEKLEDNFCAFKLPKVIHFKRRDLRINLLKENISKENLQVWGDIQLEDELQEQAQIGILEDICKGGIGFKPNPLFNECKYKLNQEISNVFFYLKDSNIILEKSVIRYMSPSHIGIQFEEISDKFKKNISEFILDFIQLKENEERENFLRRSFPERYTKHKDEQKKYYKGIVEQEPEKEEQKIDFKKTKLLIFDINDRLYLKLYSQYQVIFEQNPDKARVSLIKHMPTLLLSTIYIPQNPTERMKWFNLINEAKKKNIPIVLIFEKLYEKDKLINAVKMFGAKDIIIKPLVRDIEPITKRLNKLIKKEFSQ